MRNYKKILPYIILAELVSLVGFLIPEINALAFFAIIAFTLVAAMISLELGLLILFTELFIGSKGQLFFFEANGVLISVRIALWLIIMSVWAGKFLNLYFKKEINLSKIKKILKINFLFSYFLIFLFFIVWGVINGFINNNSFNNIFFDANAWLYFLLIFPVFTLSLIEPKYNHKKFKINLSAIFLASIIWLSLKTLILLYFFSHNIIGVVEPLYRWVRTSGVGEITNMDSGFSRIFFQSHIFVLIGIFFVITRAIKSKICHREEERQRRRGDPVFYRFVSRLLLRLPADRNDIAIVGLLCLLFATTIISFSRSNWLGLIVGLLVFFILIFYNLRASCHCEAEGRGNPVKYAHITRLLRRFAPPSYSEDRRNDKVNCEARESTLGYNKILQTTLIIFLSAIFSLILIVGIIKFPIPTPGAGFSASFISERAMQISGEAGVSSRWALLPELLGEIKKAPLLGAGFGATVSYKSSDPRVLEQNPDGIYTTYAFEWGWLDIWLKLGLLGLSAYLALIIMIFVLALDKIKKQDMAAWGLILGLIVISVVSFFSPYLNHPLGIGYVILVGFLVSEDK